MVNDSVRFDHLENDETTVWGMLLYTGYLTSFSSRRLEDGEECELLIPNREIRGLFRAGLINWFGGKIAEQSVNLLQSSNT